MEMMKTMEARHSVRQYADQPIPAPIRKELDALVRHCNQAEGLHIQIVYDEPKCFDSLMAHYGKFSGVKNYIALVGRKSADLDVKLGYYGEMIALKAQELGLNTCWVAMTHGRSAAEVRKGEKLVCLLSLGYGENEGVPHRSKPMAQLCRVDGDIPDWFKIGMEAAMLAPTAMNQQKFCFTLKADGTVEATCGMGFYTKLDLGIVKYQFEAVTEKKVNA